MSFEKLVDKVRHAEDAVEAHERRASADWHRLRRTWKASWTPGRIMVAGLATGLLYGFRDSRPGGDGPGVIRMLTMLTSLLATTSARTAAHEADQAAESADHLAEAVTGGPGAIP